VWRKLTDLTAFLIDLAIIGIVIYCAWRGYKNGLIRGVFGIVALIVSLLVANIVADAYSEEFEGLLVPFVGGIVDTTLADIASDSDLLYDDIDHEDDSEEFITAFSALREIGLPFPAAIRIAESSVDDESERPFSSLIANNLSSTLAYVAVFAVAFLLAVIVFAIIGNLIGFVFSLPGLRLLDGIAGGVFGLAKGLIIVLTLATIIRYFGLLAIDLLESTSVLNHLVNNNIIADILGM